jgi:hypothetical protein
MQCYYQVEGISINHSAECSPTDLGMYASAAIFMFLSAFCHYQTHMMLEESRPLIRHRRHPPPIEGIPDDDNYNWYQYGMIDEKEITGEGSESVPGIDNDQIEGLVKIDEEKGISQSSSVSGSNNLSGSPVSNGPAGDGMCPICMDKPQNAVCIPCGHTAGCFSCLLRNQRENRPCPICRAKVKQVVKLHRV